MTMDDLIKQRFGIHRGLTEAYKENSLEAIKAAVALKPPFVEFDVMLVNGVVRTGHPPGKPLDGLEEVLYLFEGKETYPKIDIKLKDDKPYSAVIDKVLRLVSQRHINFVLINVSGEDRDYVMQAENYLADRARDNQKIRMNIDLARYGGPKYEIGECIEKHVEKLGDVVYSISPEIHEEDYEVIAKFAEKNLIRNVCFWLRGWLDNPNPKVKEETIRKALDLEKEYNIKVYFDINPKYVMAQDVKT